MTETKTELSTTTEISIFLRRDGIEQMRVEDFTNEKEPFFYIVKIGSAKIFIDKVDYERFLQKFDYVTESVLN